MSFECARCGHVSTSKSNLLKHLRRQATCTPIKSNVAVDILIEQLTFKQYNEKTYDCLFCKKKFNTWQSKSRHHKTCKQRKSEEQDTQQTLESMKKELEETKAALKEAQSMIKSSSINGNNYIFQNNLTQNNIHNNIHVHLSDLGHENISYLPKDFLSGCFVNRDIVSLIENIHCDREHPENHNIRIRSQKRNQIELRENNKWMVRDGDAALTECIKNGYRILVRHAYRHKTEIIEDELDNDEQEYDSIREWLEAVYEKQPVQKPIKKDILLLLLSNQALLLGRDDNISRS